MSWKAQELKVRVQKADAWTNKKRCKVNAGIPNEVECLQHHILDNWKLGVADKYKHSIGWPAYTKRIAINFFYKAITSRKLGLKRYFEDRSQY